jgi:hypothetical protein
MAFFMEEKKVWLPTLDLSLVKYLREAKRVRAKSEHGRR